MVDAGLTLESERATIVKDLCSTPPEQWTDQQARWLSNRAGSKLDRIPRKLAFGSDFPYRESCEHLALSSVGAGLQASFALGGFSTVWGAAMLPNLQHDMGDWPFTLERLQPHYEACLGMTGLSADADDLSASLPLYTQTPGRLNASRQALAAMHVLERNRDVLREAGISFGRARLAVKGEREPVGSGCVYCGMCLNGCPYGFIYSAGQTVAQFRGDANFKYQSDVVVTAVEEATDHAVVHGYHRVSREPISIEADRVFLACGVIPTTAILLRSMAAYNRTVGVKDSQYFLLPAALTSRISGVANERLHTLSQLFIEILDPNVSPHSVHLQVYSYNELIGQAVRRSMGYFAGALEHLAREIEGRLMLFQGYLHSGQSSGLALTLHGSPGRDALKLAAVVNPDAARVVRKVARKLLRNSLRTSMIPLSMLLKIAEPGRGFHAGGTFPMQRQPRSFEADTLGRPLGFMRVHAVDATVLPSIPATTITFTVMANAHRIASECGALG